LRIGFGYDVHRLEEGLPLVLGGVAVPYGRGLKGHSDADVLVHAVMDALLGAMGEGDIGAHFPDTDPEYKGIASTDLLYRVGNLLARKGYSIGNIDATVVAEKPVLAEYIPRMRQTIARILGIPSGQVSVKATTTEGLGFCGRGEGMAAYAVALLE
jgi:2-C-methyl-D-erythritol 2,4-cyclodiphosphate synthase